MRLEPITSSHNSRFRAALKLHSSRGRQAQDRILVIGRREVSRAFAAGVTFEDLFLVDGITLDEPEIEAILSGAKGQSSRCSSLPESLFEKLAYGDRDASVIGIAYRPKTDLDRITKFANGPAANSMILVLEGLEKPGNLGAVARSADAGGVTAILIADSRTDIFHPNAIRASVATVFSVPIGCGTTAEIQKFLLDLAYRTCYATPDASCSLYQADLCGKIAVVIGNEARGISPAWRTEASLGVRVPMLGIGDSLNASVTASLLIYEAYRQRTGLTKNSSREFNDRGHKTTND